MKNHLNKIGLKFRSLLTDKKGISGIEIIVWISCILITCVMIYFYKNSDLVANAILGR